MTQEALKLVMDALDDLLYWDNGKPEYDEARKALQVGKQALAQTQEPVAWMDADGNVSDNNDHKCFPILLYTTPPQRTERPVDCERCNRLEEQAYDLVGKLRVANIKLSMQPQRTWVGLTDEEVEGYWDWEDFQCGAGRSTILEMVRDIEAKLKELNT